MGSRIIKNSFLALFIAISIMFVMGKGSVAELKSSVLDIVGEFISVEAQAKPDLAIDKVTLRKIADPKAGFAYYRYYATVVVENKGGEIEDAKVKLSAGNGQQHLFLKNSEEGFSLEQGKKHILDKYELIFDSRYNGGELKFSLDMIDMEDVNLGNNEKTISILEFPASVKNISLETVKDNGEYFVQFDENSEFYDHKVEVYVGDFSDEGEYLQTKGENGIYSYERLPIGKEILNDLKFQKVDYDHVGSYEVNLGVPLKEKTSTDYLYVKVVNPANGYYALSDVLKLPKPTDLTRADFAKSFIELTGEKIDRVGDTGFADVSGSEWYAPYARSIYNLGLLNFGMTNFEASTPVTREQAMKIVMDYYDADLLNNSDNLDVKDVDKDDELFQYLGNFKQPSRVISTNEFQPDANASLEFLKYLIYAYK